LSDNFLIQNCIKQGEALLLLLFNFVLEYDIRKIQENWVGLTLNGTNQLLAYGDYVNLLGDNTKPLIYVSNEVHLEINEEKTMYMLLFQH
jgi:hypothetical protein